MSFLSKFLLATADIYSVLNTVQNSDLHSMAVFSSPCNSWLLNSTATLLSCHWISNCPTWNWVALGQKMKTGHREGYRLEVRGQRNYFGTSSGHQTRLRNWFGKWWKLGLQRRIAVELGILRCIAMWRSMTAAHKRYLMWFDSIELIV